MPQIGIIILENASRTYSMGFTNIAALNNNNRGYTNHEGTSAPSLPDYVALTTGGFSNTGGHFGGNPVGSDQGSVGFEGNLNSIFSQIIGAGKSWKTYEESVTAAGYNAWSGANGLYGARHCPGAFFSYTKAAGANHGSGRYDFNELASDITNGTLPDFFLITPNIVNDGHAVSGGTNWTPTNNWVVNGNGGLFPGMTALIAALRADGVVVVTTDNIPHADTSAPITGTGVVYCVACGPNVTNGAVNTYSNHFGLLRAVQSAFGFGPLTTGVDSNYTNAVAMDLGITSTPSSPSISGQAVTGITQEGQTLTASATISGNPTPTVTYKWHYLGSTTSLGTASTYHLTSADVGHQLDVDITAANGVLPNATVTAGPSSVIIATATIFSKLYVCPDGELHIYDPANNWAQLNAFTIATGDGVRGIAAAPDGSVIYIAHGNDGGSSGGSGLLAWDVATNTVIYNASYIHGIDQIAVSTDGTEVWIPGGEVFNSLNWYVKNASDGSAKTTITTSTATGAHNTMAAPKSGNMYLGPRHAAEIEIYDTTHTHVKTLTSVGNPGSSPGMRPYTFDSNESLLFVTYSDFLGFGVVDIASDTRLFLVDLTSSTYGSFPYNSGTSNFTTPCHGISITPDETQLVLIDVNNSRIHFFDIRGCFAATPTAPVRAASPFIAGATSNQELSGTQSPCSYDCKKYGWVTHSADGQHVYVQDAGDVFETTTHASIHTISTMANTRHGTIEVLFDGGGPIFSPSHFGIGRKFFGAPPGSSNPPVNSVTDTFGTAATSSISACDDGHTWDILQGTTTQFNVSGGFLNITGVAGNAPIADIHAYSQGDEEVLMRYEFTSLATGALQSIGAAVRMTDPQNYDRAIIEQTPTGATILRVQKQIANVNTDIISGTTITSQAANTKYWLRFRVVSGTYFAKVWADGASEPVAWTVQGTDSTFNSNPGNLSGSVGIRLQCLAGNTNLATYKIDRFSSTVPSTNHSTITYQWSIDGSAFTNTGNSGNDLNETLATLSPGYHVFKVQPIDSIAGSGPISTYVWKIGVGGGTLNPPVLTAATDGIGTDLLVVDAKTTNTALILSWTQDVGSDVYISLNSGTSYQGPFTSPHTFLNMPVGAANVVLQERDSSGHVSPNTAFGYTVLQPVPVQGPGSGIYTKQLALQGIAGATVTQTIYVKATDTNALPASIIVPRTISIQIPVASTPPGVGILSPTDGDLVTTADDSVQVVVEATNANDTIATVQLTVDGTTFVDCEQQLDPNQWIGIIIIPFSVTSTITAVATDATDGLVSSDSVTVTSTVSGGGSGGGGGGGFASFNKPVPIEVFIMDHSQNDVGVILPQDIRYTEQLNQPPTITFGINLQDGMSKKIRIDPNTHDWRLERNKVPIGAGILAQSGVQIDTQSRTLTLQGEGWLGYFSRQYMLYDPLAEITKQNLTFVNEDIFNVARSVIDSVIGGPNSIPITYDHSLSGITVTQQFLASDLSDLLTIITDLGGQVQGFDFEIDPFCHYKMYSPQKGTYSNLILEYGRNIEQIQYTNPGIKANRVNAVGSGTSSSQTVALKQNSLSQKVARLYTDVAQFSNLRDYNQIGGLASAELNLDIQDQVTMVVTSRPVPGENQYALASVGDWVKVKFDLEYVSVDGFFRMTQRTFMPDNDGNEIIQYQFSPNTINVGQ